MELTYTDHNKIDQGVIQDFEFDLAYGDDENDFEIATSENVLQQGYYWYVPDTEYGGIVDEIEATTDNQTVKYRGRSFQGILESFNAIDIKSFNGLTIDNNSIIIDSDPGTVLTNIVDQLSLPFNVNVDSDQIVSVTLDRNQGLYTFLRRAFEPSGLKIVFQDDFTIAITGAIDYANDNNYDTSQYTVKVKSSNQRPNHLIGINTKDDDNTIVKHIYFDENGMIQPYYKLDSMHGFEPLHDYEYERVPDNKVITGIDEVVLVVEGGSTVETMDLVTELTDQDGNTPFKDGKPEDWDEKVYTDYYYISDVDQDTGEIKYSNPAVENEYEEFVINPTGTGQYSAEWWKTHWNECYKRSGSSPDYVYTQLSEQDCTTTPIRRQQHTIPADWSVNYSKYYRRVSENDFQSYEGIPVYDYERQDNKGDAWRDNKGDFYIDAKKYKWKVESKWRGVHKSKWVWDSLDNMKLTTKKTVADVFGSVTKTTKWKKAEKGGSTEYRVHKPVEYWHGWMKLSDWCAYKHKNLDKLGWVKGKYYLQYEKYKKAPKPDLSNLWIVYDDISDYPPRQTSGGQNIKYYYPTDLIKPAYKSGYYYRKVKNNYGELIKKMLEKYDDVVAKLNTMEPDIDVDVAEFDIGDIVGSVHPFTNEQLVSKISKKIVKGNSFKVEVSYEIG